MSEWKETKEVVPFDEAVPKANKNLVEVVRCKDCKHSDKTDCAEGFVWCNRNGEGHGTTEDWFCADGEK